MTSPTIRITSYNVCYTKLLRLAGYRKDLAPIPAELAEIKKSLETLLTHRERTEGVLGRLEALDDVLADVEARTEKMQTAREWLARTETRLEEISKQSQEQLKLLGAIMKAEGQRRGTTVQAIRGQPRNRSVAVRPVRSFRIVRRAVSYNFV